MSFIVRSAGASVGVELSGWDRAMNWTRQIDFDAATIGAVSVVERSSLEPMIDHRELGCGTHNGAKRRGRRRIGTMLGRGVSGKQFWAVRAGLASARLLVLDLHDHTFRRAVLEVDDPESFQSAINEMLTADG